MAQYQAEDITHTMSGDKTKTAQGSEKTGEEVEEWKRNVKVIPRLKDEELRLQCEWGDCNVVSSSMKESFEHVSVHIQLYLLQVLNPQPPALLSGGLCLTCGWRDCGAQILGSIIDFNRHVYFHIFHVRLKCLGAHVARVLNLGVCHLGQQSCNWIPELPDNLQCAWDGCKIIFDNPYNFYSHVNHHTTECQMGKVFKCEWDGCQTSVRDQNKLKEHLRSHTQEKLVACPTCGGLFASQSKLTDHILRQAKSQLLRYECSHCNRRFSTERMLREHMRRHVNTYKCALCEMTCPSPSALRMHVRYKHSDEKPFKCGHCEFSAKSSTDLRKHLDSHNVEDQFSCHIANCPFTARAYNSLALHYKKHHESMDINIPRYICHVCKRVFGRGFSLTHHLKTKHQFQWPPGHSRFRYKLHEDGYLHLQTVRYECADLEELPVQPSDKPNAKNAPAPRRCRRKRIVATTISNPQPASENDAQGEATPPAEQDSQPLASSAPPQNISLGDILSREGSGTVTPTQNPKKPGRKRKPKAAVPADQEAAATSSKNASTPGDLDSRVSEGPTSPPVTGKGSRKRAPRKRNSPGELVSQSSPQKGQKQKRKNAPQKLPPVDGDSAERLPEPSQKRKKRRIENSEAVSAETTSQKRGRKQKPAAPASKRNAGRKRREERSSETAGHSADVHSDAATSGNQNCGSYPHDMPTLIPPLDTTTQNYGSYPHNMPTLIPPLDTSTQETTFLDQQRQQAYPKSVSSDENPSQGVEIHWADGQTTGGRNEGAYADYQQNRGVGGVYKDYHQTRQKAGQLSQEAGGYSTYQQTDPVLGEQSLESAMSQGQVHPLTTINLQVAEYGDSAEANLHMLGDVALTSLRASKME